jgi:hypothetical protein
MRLLSRRFGALIALPERAMWDFQSSGQMEARVLEFLSGADRIEGLVLLNSKFQAIEPYTGLSAGFLSQVAFVTPALTAFEVWEHDFCGAPDSTNQLLKIFSKCAHLTELKLMGSVLSIASPLSSEICFPKVKRLVTDGYRTGDRKPYVKMLESGLSSLVACFPALKTLILGQYILGLTQPEIRSETLTELSIDTDKYFLDEFGQYDTYPEHLDKLRINCPKLKRLFMGLPSNTIITAPELLELSVLRGDEMDFGSFTRVRQWAVEKLSFFGCRGWTKQEFGALRGLCPGLTFLDAKEDLDFSIYLDISLLASTCGDIRELHLVGLNLTTCMPVWRAGMLFGKSQIADLPCFERLVTLKVRRGFYGYFEFYDEQLREVYSTLLVARFRCPKLVMLELDFNFDSNKIVELEYNVDFNEERQMYLHPIAEFRTACPKVKVVISES